LDGSGDATLNADTLTFALQPNGSAPSLEYNINGTGWSDFTGPLSFDYEDYGNADMAQIAFRLDPNINNSPLVTGGNVTFQTYDLDNSNVVGEDLFQALFVTWGAYNPSSITYCSASDPVGPHAPIPASALLLFSGLIGLIGFRRRMNHR
jgi:hypothetical protein